MQGAIWCRAKAIKQLQAVNKRCFDALMDCGGQLDRSALQGFLETADRLNQLCFVEVETADARASYKADPERLRRTSEESRRVLESELAAIVQ